MLHLYVSTTPYIARFVYLFFRFLHWNPSFFILHMPPLSCHLLYVFYLLIWCPVAVMILCNTCYNLYSKLKYTCHHGTFMLPLGYNKQTQYLPKYHRLLLRLYEVCMIWTVYYRLYQGSKIAEYNCMFCIPFANVLICSDRIRWCHVLGRFTRFCFAFLPSYLV